MRICDRMTQRVLLALGTALLTCLPAVAMAQTLKIAVIGRLSSGSANDPLHAPLLRAFHEGMRALGHEEGRTYRLEVRYAEGDDRRLPALVSELLRLDAEIIVPSGSAAVRAAKAETSKVPIVMAMAAIDPVRAGFATSLARPGGNVTGLTGLLEDLNTKHLELLREVVPERPNVMVMYQADALSRQRLGEITALGAALSLNVQFAGIARYGDFASAFAEARSANVGGIVTIPAPALMDRHRAHIAALAIQHRLPTVSPFRMYADAGGLISYGVDLRDIYRRAAGYVDKILKGAKPADLPIEQPTKFELVINLKTAKALALAIPPALLARADEVIE
jgi:putative tryptophan/tyrosine transport system substrate-binding protein